MVDQRFLRDDFDSVLSHFIEECGECLAAAGKLQRWGPESVNPFKENGPTNVEWLYRELLDIKLTSHRLIISIEELYGTDE